MSAERKIWQDIKFFDEWRNADTSVVDDLIASWFLRKKKLQNNDSEYKEFLERLKREHAIETGVIERLYDLSRGVTQTLIEHGFIDSYISHGDSNIPTRKLMTHLNDHMNAVNFVFDMIAGQRQLSTSFIKELHALVTKSQDTTEGVDQFGNSVDIKLTKGVYKTQENNPSRSDGVKFKYCPVIHVAMEMENLISVYDALEEQNVHPVIIAAWLHHAFTQIHPFQDGNGRVARLLASLVLIKHDYFPFTVAREARHTYFDALEAADNGEPQALVMFFSQGQRAKVEQALSVKEIGNTTLDQVTDILVSRLDEQEQKRQERDDEQKALETKYNQVFEMCRIHMQKLANELKNRLDDRAQVNIQSYPIDKKSWTEIHDTRINILFPNMKYAMLASVASDPENNAMEINVFFIREHSYSALPNLPPHLISIADDIEPKIKGIEHYLEDALSISLAQIANEIDGTC